MVLKLLIYFAMSLSSISTVSSVLWMKMIRCARNTCHRFYGFLKKNNSSARGNVTNGKGLLICRLSRIISIGLDKITCVGAGIIRWIYKRKLYSLEIQKARICRPGLFNTFYGKCMMNGMNTLIIAFSDFTYNCLSENYV